MFAVAINDHALEIIGTVAHIQAFIRRYFDSRHCFNKFFDVLHLIRCHFFIRRFNFAGKFNVVRFQRNVVARFESACFATGQIGARRQADIFRRLDIAV